APSEWVVSRLIPRTSCGGCSGTPALAVLVTARTGRHPHGEGASTAGPAGDLRAGQLRPLLWPAPFQFCGPTGPAPFQFCGPTGPAPFQFCGPTGPADLAGGV